MNVQKHRTTFAVATTFAALLLLLLAIGQYVLHVHAGAASTLNEVEPRYARLVGLREAAAQLDDGLKQARAAVSRLGHTATRDATQIGNELQQTVRRALQSAGLAVGSSQVLPPRSESGLDRVAVAVQAEGPLSGVQAVLAALQGESPAVIVEGLVLQSTGRAAEDGSPIVTCRMTVAVFRLQT